MFHKDTCEPNFYNCTREQGLAQEAQMVKNTPAGAGNGFDPLVRPVPWGEKWQPTPVFLPGKLHGQSSLVVIEHGIPKGQVRPNTHGHRSMFRDNDLTT